MKVRDNHETWTKLIETYKFRYMNLSLFDPELELLVEDYLEALDESRV